MLAFIKKIVQGVAQGIASGHTVDTAKAAVMKVLQARDKIVAMEKETSDAIEAAKQARVATIAAIHADIAAFEAIKRALGK